MTLPAYVELTAAEAIERQRLFQAAVDAGRLQFVDTLLGARDCTDARHSAALGELLAFDAALREKASRQQETA